MAQSRLEKIGTIYSRVTNLLKTGAVKEESKPIWYNIYKAFPPKYEPRYDRPSSNAQLRQIFYPEDTIRAKFHTDVEIPLRISLFKENVVSKTEEFLAIYKELEKNGVPEAELYDKALSQFKTLNQRLFYRKAEQQKFKHLLKQVLDNSDNADILAKDDIDNKARHEFSDGTVMKDQDDEDIKNNSEYKPIYFSLKKLLKETDEDVTKLSVDNIKNEQKSEPIKSSIEKPLQDKDDEVKK